MMIQKWENRPLEIANLFNPAYCSMVLLTAIKAYQQESGRNIPLPLIYLILPTVLHRRTRELLPSTVRGKMHNWILTHPEIRNDFPTRVRNLKPITEEALSFILARNMANISSEGIEILGRIPNPSQVWSTSKSSTDILNRSKFIGKWFAKAGNVVSIYAMWGIRP